MRQKFIKIGSFIIMAAAVIFTTFSTTSCGDTDNNDPALKIDISSKDVVADGEEFVFKITSANTSWTVTTSEPSWTEIDKSAGEGNATVTVKVLKNETTSQRTATITVEATDHADLDKTLTITQEPGVPVDPPASFADSLEGEWTVSYLYCTTTEEGIEVRLPVNSQLTMTKVSDTQMRFEHFMTDIVSDPEPINIIINDDNTISIEAIPFGEGVYLCSYIESDMADNFMKGWERLPVVDGVIEFNGYPEAVELLDGSMAYGSWVSLIETNGEIDWFGTLFANMKWQKVE